MSGRSLSRKSTVYYDALEEDVNKQDKIGMTRLHRAAKKGDIKVVAALLQQPGIDANKQDDDERTPLHLAARNGRHKVVVALLRHPGIAVNNQDIYGRTPLHLATKSGHSEVVAALLQHPDIDANKQDEEGKTPLDRVAIKDNLTKMHQLLLRPGDTKQDSTSTTEVDEKKRLLFGSPKTKRKSMFSFGKRGGRGKSHRITKTKRTSQTKRRRR